MLTKTALATSTKQLGSPAVESLPNAQNAKLIGPEVETLLQTAACNRTAAPDR